jgi:hypothetical protein
VQATHCPICHELLEVRDVAPCMECGCEPSEIEEAKAGEHSYAEFRIFGALSLVLCNFCQADFSSYDPTYFGLPRGTSVGMERGWQLVRVVQPFIAKGKCCPQCRHRLPFLEFVVAARAQHGAH